MVKNVSASDVEVEGVDESWVVSVDGAEGSLQEVPAGGVVVWDIVFSVLEESETNQPGVSDQIGTDVHGQDNVERGSLSPKIQYVDHSDQSEVREDELWEHLLLEQFIWDEEVACESSFGSSSDTESKISRPAENETHSDTVERETVLSDSVSESEVEFSTGTGALIWDVGLSFVDVTGSGVVDVVAVLPIEIWDQVESVEDISKKIVCPLLFRESAVSAFVTQNPESDGNGSADNSVEDPNGDHVGSEWDEFVSKETGQEGEGSRECDTDEESSFVSLEQIGRDGLSDLFDGEFSVFRCLGSELDC